MKDFFLAPGRQIAKLLSKDKKRYRSARHRSDAGMGTVVLSGVFWLVLAGGLILAVDKLGFLTPALDVGLEVAQGGGEEAPTPPPAPEPTSNITGSLETGSPAGAPLPPASGVANAATATAPAVETELWLVILHTIPKSARDEAERRQAQYLSKGLRVDILDTDAFPRLKSGNWIIAQGPFDDRASALAAADAAKGFNPGLMVRRGL